jgi:periplasmic protein TonB
MAPPAALPAGAAAVDELGPTARRVLTGGVLAAHVLGGWALLQVDAVRQAVIEAAPIMVSMIAAPEPPKPAPPPPPPKPQPPRPRPAPAPVIAAAPSPAPAPPAFVVPAPEPAPTPVVAVAPTPPAPPAPPAQVAPSVPKMIPPSAVRYVVEPRLTVPLLSRRLGEQGIVHLRVVVDVRGQLKEASLKKSSGFARIDQQALQDIRTARFAPYTDNGQAIEWETTALLSYELDR